MKPNYRKYKRTRSERAAADALTLAVSGSLPIKYEGEPSDGEAQMEASQIEYPVEGGTITVHLSWADFRPKVNGARQNLTGLAPDGPIKVRFRAKITDHRGHYIHPTSKWSFTIPRGWDPNAFRMIFESEWCNFRRLVRNRRRKPPKTPISSDPPVDNDPILQ